jgi:hypothetical protein
MVTVRTDKLRKEKWDTVHKEFFPLRLIYNQTEQVCIVYTGFDNVSSFNRLIAEGLPYS